eukprot:TRINITY_DN95795_c0_g1_i1.p1 TRINITY_DN95795_c0_g1~~TRINITY_DN95795_c0_g1_i1.p1  ORF type:complete len:647 (-),score=82.22 TRINITY_DN95795_c0_g1_i1:6-1946(-)
MQGPYSQPPPYIPLPPGAPPVPSPYTSAPPTTRRPPPPSYYSPAVPQPHPVIALLPTPFHARLEPPPPYSTMPQIQQLPQPPPPASAPPSVLHRPRAGPLVTQPSTVPLPPEPQPSAHGMPRVLPSPVALPVPAGSVGPSPALPLPVRAFDPRGLPPPPYDVAVETPPALVVPTVPTPVPVTEEESDEDDEFSAPPPVPPPPQPTPSGNHSEEAEAESPAAPLNPALAALPNPAVLAAKLQSITAAPLLRNTNIAAAATKQVAKPAALPVVIDTHPPAAGLHIMPEQLLSSTADVHVALELHKLALLHFVIVPRVPIWGTCTEPQPKHAGLVGALLSAAQEVSSRFSNTKECRDFLLANRRRFAPKARCRCTSCERIEEWPATALEWLEQNDWAFDCPACRRSVKWAYLPPTEPAQQELARGVRWSGGQEVTIMEKAFGVSKVTFVVGFEAKELVHLQLHVLSTDFAFVGNCPKEWNRWTALVHPSRLIGALKAGNPLKLQPRDETEVVCPNCHENFNTVPEAQQHLQGQCSGKAARKAKPAPEPEPEPAAKRRRKVEPEQTTLWEPLLKPPLKPRNALDLEGVKAHYLKWWDYYYAAKSRKEREIEVEALRHIKELAVNPLLSAPVMTQLKPLQQQIRAKHFAAA